MNVTYKTPDGRLSFQFEADTVKGVFGGIAKLQEVFEVADKCGKCGSTQIRFEIRDFDGNSYYKFRCDDCTATLDFGQNKNGKDLFPKIKGDADASYKPLPNGGWYIYEGKNRQDDGGHQEPQQAWPTEPPRQQPQRQQGGGRAEESAPF